ncbi:MAG: trypsin-like serine protease [Deltaproteobacteria bacterium]|nr:trypsin-like serine protease [Deltaproteobacteria bacterium]
MEVKFLFKNGSRNEKSVDFKGVFLLNLGSNTDNDMVFNLPEDSEVSPYHTQIRQMDNMVFVQDMGSASGTFLNGQRITKTQLTDGDIIQLGMGGPRFCVSVTADAAAMIPGENATQKIYGKKTVGLMIQQALKSAGNGMNRTTSYFEGILEARLNMKTRRYRIAVIVIFALLVTFGAALGFFMYYSTHYPSVKLLANESEAAEYIARENRHNVFLLAGLPRSEPKDSGNWQGFCTAFAIGADLLATNAHCVQKARSDYQTVWALMNEVPKSRYKVIKMLHHPEYAPGTITPDVGLLRISERLDTWVKMAAQPQLKSLEQGTFIYIYGFPGRLSNLASPVATFVRGEIGRITNTHQQPGSYAENILLQHSAVISEGTSGSPMFNLDGDVVGVNAGGYAADGHMMMGYNFGIRIDSIAPLLQSITSATATVE